MRLLVELGYQAIPQDIQAVQKTDCTLMPLELAYLECALHVWIATMHNIACWHLPAQRLWPGHVIAPQLSGLCMISAARTWHHLLIHGCSQLSIYAVLLRHNACTTAVLTRGALIAADASTCLPFAKHTETDSFSMRLSVA